MKTVSVGDDGKTTITSPYMNIAEAALYCRCPEAVIVAAIADRSLTYIQFGEHTIVLSQEDLNAFLKEHEVLNRYNYLNDPPDDAAPGRA